jgi:cytosine/adenosine deaminase-related metal-dependent hydrolase
MSVTHEDGSARERIRAWLADPFCNGVAAADIAEMLADFDRLAAGYDRLASRHAAVNTGDVYLVEDSDGDGPTVWCGAADDPYPLHILAKYQLPGPTLAVRDRVWAALTGHLPTRAAETDPGAQS